LQKEKENKKEKKVTIKRKDGTTIIVVMNYKNKEM